MNKYRTTQSGITLFGMVFLVLVLAMFFLIAIKLFPMYMESFKVTSVVQSLNEREGVMSMSNREITRTIVNQLNQFENVNSVKAEDIFIERGASEITVTVEYEVYKPIVGNLGFLASFNKVVKLK